MFPFAANCNQAGAMIFGTLLIIICHVASVGNYKEKVKRLRRKHFCGRIEKNFFCMHKVELGSYEINNEER